MTVFDDKDEDIYLRILDDLEEGAKALLQTYESYWRAFLHRKYQGQLNDADFDEIILAAVYKICKSVSKYDERRRTFRFWAFKIMKNLAIDYLRAAAKGIGAITLDQEAWELQEASLKPYSDEEDIETIEPDLKAALYDAFEALPELQKQVLQIVADNPGIAASEIRDFLKMEGKDVSTTHVGVLKKRAKDRLKTALASYRSHPKIKVYYESED